MKILITIISLLLMIGPSYAEWPERTVTVVAGVAAGNGSDAIGRIIVDKLSEKLNKPFIVDNKGGAGGSIGTKYVINSTSDGYTILFNTISMVISVPTIKSAKYNINEDLIPIIPLVDSSFVLVTKHNKFTDYNDLISTLKNKGLLGGSNGYSGQTYLLLKYFDQLINTKEPVTVPYKGTQDIIADIIGGRIDYSFLPIQSVSQLMYDKQLDIWGVTTQSRSDVIPNIPTFTELGIPELSFHFWSAMFVPKNTSPEIVEKLYNALVEIKESESFKQQVKQLGVSIYPTISIKEFKDQIKKDLEFYQNLVPKISQE